MRRRVTALAFVLSGAGWAGAALGQSLPESLDYVNGVPLSLGAVPGQPTSLDRVKVLLAPWGQTVVDQAEQEIWRMPRSLDERHDRFNLYSACSPMHLSVGALSADAVALGLSADEVAAPARTRLREARLYVEDRQAHPFHPTLIVTVAVEGQGAATSVEFAKHLIDPLTAETGFVATTWDQRIVGTHGGEAPVLTREVARLTDRFVAEYLRVNRADCR